MGYSDFSHHRSDADIDADIGCFVPHDQQHYPTDSRDNVWTDSWFYSHHIAKPCQSRFAETVHNMDIRFVIVSDMDIHAGNAANCGDWTCDSYMPAEAAECYAARRKLCTIIRHKHQTNKDFDCYIHCTARRCDNSFHWSYSLHRIGCSTHCETHAWHERPSSDHTWHDDDRGYIAACLRYLLTVASQWFGAANQRNIVDYRCTYRNMDNIEKQELTMMLEARNITIGYRKKTIQSGVNLKAHDSELISLIGTNGTGKSTLLRSLAALQPILCGEIYVDGQEIHHVSPNERARKISVVLTDTIVAEQLTVYDLIAMGRIPYTSWTNIRGNEDEEIILNAANEVNLSHKIHSPVNELSDGEKQRATIARALAQDTPVILLDEPTSHLDMPNRVEIMILLKRLAEERHKTIIISTHELNLALSHSHYIWLLTRTEPVIADTPENILQNPLFQTAFASEHFDPKKLR